VTVCFGGFENATAPKETQKIDNWPPGLRVEEKAARCLNQDCKETKRPKRDKGKEEKETGKRRRRTTTVELVLGEFSLLCRII
jgi:hypothetical protein